MCSSFINKCVHVLFLGTQMPTLSELCISIPQSFLMLHLRTANEVVVSYRSIVSETQRERERSICSEEMGIESQKTRRRSVNTKILASTSTRFKCKISPVGVIFLRPRACMIHGDTLLAAYSLVVLCAAGMILAHGPLFRSRWNENSTNWGTSILLFPGYLWEAIPGRSQVCMHQRVVSKKHHICS